MDLVLLRSTPFRLFNLGLHLSLNRFCVNGSKLIWALSGGGQVLILSSIHLLLAVAVCSAFLNHSN